MSENKEQLRLTCLVTGKSRPTTQVYLETKAQRLGGNVSDVITNYICREAMVLLNSGESIDKVRATLNVASTVATPGADKLSAAVRFNGKRSRSTTEA